MSKEIEFKPKTLIQQEEVEKTIKKFEDDKEFFEKLDVVVVDECHGAKANVINKILKNCISVRVRSMLKAIAKCTVFLMQALTVPEVEI